MSLLIILVPIALFAVIVLVLVLALRPRSEATPARTDARGTRSVACVDAPEDAALGDAIRASLEARGATVAVIDHDYAIELDVLLEGEGYRLSVGWVDDPDAPWKVFVDGVSGDGPSESALEATHAVLVGLTDASNVRWTTRESDTAGHPEWWPRPVDE